ncbi:NADH-quinone oxidoreductase [Komagataeibacter rhaeticus]|nr:NADH-quinone oxidoreductase [Komagataeibacter rhaeticus]
MTLRGLVGAGRPAACAGRFELGADGWRMMVEALPRSTARLCGLWSDGMQVHALFHDGPGPFMASVAVPEGRYLALSPARPGAEAHERMLHDLWGIEAMGAVGTAPWLDQGQWGVTWPLRERAPPAPPRLKGSSSLMARPWNARGHHAGPWPGGGWIPCAPASAAGPAGEGITQVRPRMGYAHRGLCARMRGNTLAGGARLAARIDAGATVAHQLAFARAVAAASGVDPSCPQAIFPAELERVATHLDSVAQMAELQADGRLANLAATLLEHVRQLGHAVYGHRLLFDVVPRRDAAAPAPEVMAALHEGCATLRRLFWRPRGLATQLLGRGVLSAGAARQWGSGAAWDGLRASRRT